MAHQRLGQCCCCNTGTPSLGARRPHANQCLQPPVPAKWRGSISTSLAAVAHAASTWQRQGCQPAIAAVPGGTWKQTRSLLSSNRPHSMAAAAQQPKSSSSSSGVRPSQPEEGEQEDDGYVEYDDDEFEEGEYDEAEDGFLDGEDEDSLLLGLEMGDARPGVDTGDSNWAQLALKAVQRVLSLPAMDNLQLYVFRALPGNKLDIRLDRLDDPYGSPSIDDIEKFSRMLGLELEAALGVQAAADISLEVSSPGAERVLRVPEDLARFAGLPLYVEYRAPDAGTNTNAVLLLNGVDEAAGTSSWKLADVRANAPGKGRKLSKRQREMVFSIPLDSLKLVRVHVDF